ncbi:DUF4911 domain-containing protein [Candidatus Babeliales bacterium]|nr:DUF4911 domain-containing protein [Candidatus Babeliales bacterium]MCF7899769.1 DUF4911 domain-containing protein [Candidatus Babeliales bacterium]
MYCQYYQAHTQRSKTWFVIGCFKAEDNIAFVRTLEKQSSLLEFFVPEGQEQHFLKLMNYLLKNEYLLDYQKMPNRLLDK